MKMIDASGIGPFRITSDGDARDVQEIHGLLKEYNRRHREVFTLEEYPYTGKRHYYTKKLL